MVTSGEATPLWISPLVHHPANDDSGQYSYQVLQRLVTSSPNSDHLETEIETALEAYIGPEGDVLWRRVVVRSGSSSPHQVIHSSFSLPNEAPVESDSVLCWAAFPERPNHKLLCVLASPTLLCIWDVYPSLDSDLGGEGHSIPLPFEACAIYAIGDKHGLLLQRKDSIEDRLAYDVQNKTWTMAGLQGADDDDDGFILKAPPRPVRLQGDMSGARSIGSLPVSASSNSVPSLFSLSHPLDDVLPISLLADDSIQTGTITDVFEKVLFVGMLRWTDPNEDILDRREYTQPICVTYHTQRKRHAIWEIKSAPPPPPQAPLWQVSGQWRSDIGWNSHLGVLQQDLEDLELLGTSEEEVDSSHYDSTTRNEALADALGVRKTPRKVVEDMAPRSRSVTARSKQRIASNNNSLLSPLSRALNDTHVHMQPETTVEYTGGKGSAPPLLSLGPFSSLHPTIAMKCLYEESKMSSQAVDVFLASNLEASGTLVVCLVCPVDGQTNPNELKLFSFDSNGAREEHKTFTDASGDLIESFGRCFAVNSIPATPCVSAQPVQTTPIPPCFRPHQRNDKGNRKELAEDILLLRRIEFDVTALALYRTDMHIVDCALPMIDDTFQNSSNTSDVLPAFVASIGNAVNNHVDLVCLDGLQQEISVRGHVSLMMTSNALCENTLQAVDAAMFSAGEKPSDRKAIEVALKLRADCVRMEQALSKGEQGQSPLFEDTHCSAVETALSAIFEFDLLGVNTNQEKLQNEHGTNAEGSAWESLLQSEFHQFYSDEYSELLDGIGDVTVQLSAAQSGQDLFHLLRGQLASIHSLSLHCMASCNKSFSNRIFDALHFLYEDFKLCCDSKGAAGLRFLGSVLGRACLTEIKASPPDKNEVHLFLEHYRRDLGEHWLARLKSSCEKTIAVSSLQQRSEEGITAYASPPCILSRIDRLISGEVDGGFYNDCDLSSLNAACSRTRSLIRILSMLFLGTDDHIGMSEEKKDVERHRDHAIVTALIEEGFTNPAVIRDELPPGIALPLLEVLHRCRGDPAMADVSDLDALAWSLVGREDLRKNIETINLRFLEEHKGAHRPTTSSHDTDSSRNENTQFEDKAKDGTAPLEFTSSMLFPNDNRIREVGRMLRSSRPTFLSVPRAIEVSDHDFEKMKQDKLLLLSRRVLAQPVGRGMLTIGNLQPVPAEPLPLPDLCLTGRVPPTNAILALDTTDCPTDLRVWPEFHNGVAAGLRLPLGEDADEIVSKITRTWIVYNRPQRNNEPQSQNNPNTPNPSQNLSHSHGGMLMALGLRGHLTTLEMTDIFDYLTQGTVTTTVGVLLGMAANMRGSCDISVSKMLCLHIPSLIPHHFSSIDVASPVQAAAVAGTGLLYQGSSHRMITEFLLNEIGKRPASDVNAFDREAYTLSCGISLGMVNLCQGERINGDVEGSGSAGLADLRIEERLYRYVVGGIDDVEMRRRKEENDRLSVPSSSAANSNEKCSCVFEGESINTDITAPGATLALGLIYMKSGNKTIASAIALPDTHFLLEYVRPDFLMLRVIARALILWNDVKPSKDWIESQLPPVVRKAYRQMRDAAKKASGFTGLSNLNQTDDESNAMDTQNPVDEERLKQNPNISSLQPNQDFDRQAVRQIHAHVIAGACFGIGLRFAGTGDSEASAAIFDCVMELQELRDSNDPVSGALRPAGPVLEMCLGCAATSLAMVMAGSGDLDTLKLLKTLRWRCEEDVKYGTHMTYGAAIGLLFLGGGTCTLGREPQDIAALVMSFYPRYPSTTSDNQYHLQALRNLYAIAVKQRELRAVDVDTGESVFVPIEIHFSNKSASPLHLNAPCLLYNTDQEPKELRVVSDRYYPLTLNIGSPSLGRTFFVKKRSAHLSYRQDPDSDRSLLVQTGSFRGGAFLDIVGSFTEDPRVLAFAQYFCDVGDAHSNQRSHPFSVAGFCTRVLHECLTLDTEEALPFYLALRSVVLAVKKDSSAAVRFVWDFRLIRSYYERRQKIISNSSTRLLNEELVTYLCGLLENTLIESASGRNGNTANRSLGPTSAYFDVPLDTDLSSEMNLQVTDSMDLSL